MTHYILLVVPAFLAGVVVGWLVLARLGSGSRVGSRVPLYPPPPAIQPSRNLRGTPDKGYSAPPAASRRVFSWDGVPAEHGPDGRDHRYVPATVTVRKVRDVPDANLLLGDGMYQFWCHRSRIRAPHGEPPVVLNRVGDRADVMIPMWVLEEAHTSGLCLVDVL